MPDIIPLPAHKPAMDVEACLKHLDGPFVTTEALLHAVVDVLRSQLSLQLHTSRAASSSRTPPPASGPSHRRSSEETS